MNAAVWDAVGDTLGQRLADDLRDMVRVADDQAERSQQRSLGPSEIGDPCTRCLAAKILGLYEQPQFDDPWCRILGTAGHDWLDGAAATYNVVADKPRWFPEAKVRPDDELLPNGGRCDLYDDDTKTVIDHKIVGAAQLKNYKANGPGQKYRVQAHLYGKGYMNRGHEIRHVAVAFWNRGGRLSDLHVWTEPYNVAIADAALDRYRLLRDLVAPLGAAVLPQLPTDSDCYSCSRSNAA